MFITQRLEVNADPRVGIQLLTSQGGIGKAGKTQRINDLGRSKVKVVELAVLKIVNKLVVKFIFQGRILNWAELVHPRKPLPIVLRLIRSQQSACEIRKVLHLRTARHCEPIGASEIAREIFITRRTRNSTYKVAGNV